MPAHGRQPGRGKGEGAHGAGPGRGGRVEVQQGAGQAQHPRGGPPPLVRVRVQQGIVPGVHDRRRETPAQAHGVGDAGVEPLTAGGRVDVGGVAGQDDAAVAVAGRVTALAPIAAAPLHVAQREVASRDAPQQRTGALRYDGLVRVRRARPVVVEDDAPAAVAERQQEGHAVAPAPAPRLLPVDVQSCADVQPRVDGHDLVRIHGPGRGNAREAAHAAAGSVAAGHVGGAHPAQAARVAHGHHDALGLLAQPDDLRAPDDQGAPRTGVRGQQGFGPVLRQGEGTGEGGVQRGEGRGGARGAQGIVPVAVSGREKGLGDAAHVEVFEGPGVQDQRPCRPCPARLPFQDGTTDAAERQLPGQLKAHRTRSHDDHLDGFGKGKGAGHPVPFLSRWSWTPCSWTRCSGTGGAPRQRGTRQLRCPDVLFDPLNSENRIVAP